MRRGQGRHLTSSAVHQAKMLIIYILLIPFCLWGLARGYYSVVFDQQCGGYLKRAADANTVELATIELDVALTYMKKTNLTKGYTSILWNTPADDVRFWHDNIESAFLNLKEIGPETSQLERSNTLLKLRETLLDHGEKGDTITCPEGISVFPHNMLFAFFGTIGCILAVFAFFLYVRYS